MCFRLRFYRRAFKRCLTLNKISRLLPLFLSMPCFFVECQNREELLENNDIKFLEYLAKVKGIMNNQGRALNTLFNLKGNWIRNCAMQFNFAYFFVYLLAIRT